MLIGAALNKYQYPEPKLSEIWNDWFQTERQINNDKRQISLIF